MFTISLIAFQERVGGGGVFNQVKNDKILFYETKEKVIILRYILKEGKLREI